MPTEPLIDTSYCDLDDERIEQILSHVARTWRLGACRTCEGTFYQLLAQITLRFSSRTDVILDSRAYERQSAGLVCTTCGEIRILDLSVANVYERAPSRKPVPDAPTSTGPYR
jgi:hypothetical protein